VRVKKAGSFKKNGSFLHPNDSSLLTYDNNLCRKLMIKNPEEEVNQGFNILRPHHRSHALSNSARLLLSEKNQKL